MHVLRIEGISEKTAHFKFRNTSFCRLERCIHDYLSQHIGVKKLDDLYQHMRTVVAIVLQDCRL